MHGEAEIDSQTIEVVYEILFDDKLPCSSDIMAAVKRKVEYMSGIYPSFGTEDESCLHLQDDSLNEILFLARKKYEFAKNKCTAKASLSLKITLIF